MRTCDEHFLSLFLDWSTRNRVLFPRSYHLGECRRSLRAETGGTCREYERGRLSSGFSAASRRGPGASSNHANGRSRSHSRKKPFFENFTEKYLPIVAGNYAHVVPRYFLKFSSMKFEDILSREELLFLDIRNLSRMELFSIELISMKSKIFFWRERERKIIKYNDFNYW